MLRVPIKSTTIPLRNLSVVPNIHSTAKIWRRSNRFGRFAESTCLGVEWHTTPDIEVVATQNVWSPYRSSRINSFMCLKHRVPGNLGGATSIVCIGAFIYTPSTHSPMWKLYLYMCVCILHTELGLGIPFELIYCRPELECIARRMSCRKDLDLICL